MTAPRIVEVDKNAPIPPGPCEWLTGMLEEGVFISEIAIRSADRRLVGLEAGNVVFVCRREDGECFLIGEYRDQEEWLSRLPDRFKVVLGVRPRQVECGRLAGCARDTVR
jgi:hypothetical protein